MKRIIAWVFLALLVPGAVSATDLGTAFTYQGQLKQAESPVTGSADFQFKLWDAADGGTAVGSMVELLAQPVSAGVFNVQLDFGTVPFRGAARWLAIVARYPAGTGSYTLLTPRQPIEATPYAAYALDVKGMGFKMVGDIIYTLNTEAAVGLGLSTPLAKFHVRDNNGVELTTDALSAETMIIESEGTAVLGLYSPGTGNPGSAVILSEKVSSDQPTKWAMYRTGINGTPAAQLRFGYGSLGSYSLYSTVMALNATGNVGIGTTAPAAKLDVNGTAKLTGFQMPTGAANGYVLTADASGVGTWAPGYAYNGPWLTAGNNVYYNAGNVGIGTSTPAYSLTVAGSVSASGSLISGGSLTSGGAITANGPVAAHGDITTVDVGNVHSNVISYNSSNEMRIKAGIADYADAGGVATLGPSNQGLCAFGFLVADPDKGAVVAMEHGTQKAGVYVNASGQGVVWGDVKNFREPSREDVNQDIWYASVEGPEAAAYVRGTATLEGGSATVELPGHFQQIATLDGMTVQVTPRSPDSKGLAVVTRALDRFVVRELFAGTGAYEFDWEVKAVRRAHQDYQVMRPWDHAMMGGTDRAAAWQGRLTDIQERDRRIETTESQRKGR